VVGRVSIFAVALPTATGAVSNMLLFPISKLPSEMPICRHGLDVYYYCVDHEFSHDFVVVFFFVSEYSSLSLSLPLSSIVNDFIHFCLCDIENRNWSIWARIRRPIALPGPSVTICFIGKRRSWDQRIRHIRVGSFSLTFISPPIIPSR
jgi:hypothetical protein